MSSMTQINGTNYKITNAKTMSSSTNYSIKKGKTFVNGTNYNISVEPPFPKPSSHTPRDIITWDNKEWLVCHYDSSTNRVYLIAKDIISRTRFGSNTKYAGSTLASVALNYQTNNMSAAALNMCVDITVNGVTAKVFVPSYQQMNGGFSWFDRNARRIAEYNQDYFSGTYYYWTSTTISESYVY